MGLCWLHVASLKDYDSMQYPRLMALPEKKTVLDPGVVGEDRGESEGT